MVRVIAAVAFAITIALPTASAQQIYSCGNGVYQQTPCPKGTASKAINYKRVPDSPTVQYGSTGSQAADYSSHQRPTVAPSAARPPSRGGIIANPGGMSLQDKLRQIATDSAYKGSASARRAAMNAALQEAGYQGVGDYQPPKPAYDPGIGQPVNAIDSQTGMPINGAVRVAPNQIWDPNTGQYRSTY
ncbi:hypothetical protein BW38_03485 [Stenotrophomonas sp. RIT309]|uniref:hypothetical protein n=1 Tax=Stenotrophomonas sp. RIT309 TaxID=1470590 RepID=UPI00044CDD65|nr:hypothetical protein [Stenotrophomonas sp. RIT309]EZP43139.1 hypothetical protein BW38_03485 [Stenotrophomonas sp. RIT309]